MAPDPDEMRRLAFGAALIYFAKRPAEYVKNYGTMAVVRMTYIWKDSIRRKADGQKHSEKV